MTNSDYVKMLVFRQLCRDDVSFGFAKGWIERHECEFQQVDAYNSPFDSCYVCISLYVYAKQQGVFCVDLDAGNILDAIDVERVLALTPICTIEGGKVEPLPFGAADKLESAIDEYIQRCGYSESDSAEQRQEKHDSTIPRCKDLKDKAWQILEDRHEF